MRSENAWRTGSGRAGQRRGKRSCETDAEEPLHHPEANVDVSALRLRASRS